MEWTLGLAAIILLVMGLIGQAFEMRNIHQSTTTPKDDESGSADTFMNKRNFKWYALIGIGILLWYAAERA